MTIEPIKLANAVEFDKAFFALLQKKICTTHQDAFEHLNEIYREATGINRYASYDSFRICRNNRMKKKSDD
jgi:hypothetical protein